MFFVLLYFALYYLAPLKRYDLSSAGMDERPLPPEPVDDFQDLFDKQKLLYTLKNPNVTVVAKTRMIKPDNTSLIFSYKVDLDNFLNDSI